MCVLMNKAGGPLEPSIFQRQGEPMEEGKGWGVGMREAYTNGIKDHPSTVTERC